MRVELGNLDCTIVNNQGLEISRKHKSKCIEKSEQKAILNMQNIEIQYVVLSSSTFPTSDEQKNQTKESQVFSSFQATIWDTEDWNNLDQVIVTIQGLEVTKKHKIKCI